VLDIKNCFIILKCAYKERNLLIGQMNGLENIMTRSRILMQYKSIQYADSYHKYAKNMQNDFFLQINNIQLIINNIYT
jgi:hypothetical protein